MSLILLPSKNVLEGIVASRENGFQTYDGCWGCNLDQNYQPIGPSYPSTTPGSYTVRSGDTLKTIASALWGDSAMWYLIADANGLSGTETLTEDMVLVIPNKVTNIHNNSSTFAVYNPGEAIGDTSPTLPEAPPPPAPKGGGCSGAAMIITVIVAIVATMVGLGPMIIQALGTVFGAATPIVAAALTAATISTVSQGISVAVGAQDKFSWSAVGSSALMAGISAGVGIGLEQAGLFTGTDPVSVGMRYGVSNAITQGVAVTTGLQKKFSWSSVASSAITAGTSAKMGWSLTSPEGVVGRGLVSTIVTGLSEGRDADWSSIAVQSFGHELAQSIAARSGHTGTNKKNFSDDMQERKAETDWWTQAGRTQQSGADVKVSATQSEPSRSPSYVMMNGQAVKGNTLAAAGDVTNESVSVGQIGQNGWVPEGLANENVLFHRDARLGYGQSGTDRLQVGQTVEAQQLMLKKQAEYANSLALGRAIEQGASLAPTIENAARLDLYNTSGDLPISYGVLDKVQAFRADQFLPGSAFDVRGLSESWEMVSGVTPLPPQVSGPIHPFENYGGYTGNWALVGEQGVLGTSKLQGLRVLNRAGKLHRWTQAGVGAASDLNGAIGQFKSPNGKTAQALAQSAQKFGPALRGLGWVGIGATIVEETAYVARMPENKYWQALGASATNIAGDTGAMLGGMKIGAGIGAGFGSAFPPIMPFTTLVGAGVGAIAGHIVWSRNATDVIRETWTGIAEPKDKNNN